MEVMEAKVKNEFSVSEGVNNINILTERVKKRKKEFDKAPIIPSGERSRLVTESWRKTEKEPVVIRRAELFRNIMEHSTPIIREDELIVGSQTKYVRGAPCCIEYFPDAAEKGLRDGTIFQITEDKTGTVIYEDEKKDLLEGVAYWKESSVKAKLQNAWERMFGDTLKDCERARLLLMQNEIAPLSTRCGDYEKVLKVGLKGLAEQAKRHMERIKLETPEDIEKIDFLRAVLITLEGVVVYARRHAALAREMAAKESNPRRKRELEEIARVCDWVPENPARNFREAVQSFWFIMLCMMHEVPTPGVAQGRVDQFLWPYYEKDRKEGRITRQKAGELLSLLWVKLNEMEVFKESQHQEYSASNKLLNVTIGGVTRTGEDAVNELTHIMLEICRQLRLPQPQLVLRYHEHLSDAFFSKVIEINRDLGAGAVTILNDKKIVKDLTNYNMSIEDSRDYVGHGCIHSDPGQTYCAQRGPGFINMAKVLELTLNNGFDPIMKKQLGIQTGDPRQFETYEEFEAAFRKQVEYFVDLCWKGGLVAHQVRQANYGLPFHSALISDCIERGKEQAAGGNRYACSVHNGIQVKSPQNVANSLMAVKKLVFDENKITMDQLLEALKANFEGYEGIHQMLLSAPKWGNDNDEVDAIFSSHWSWSHNLVKSVPTYVDRSVNMKPLNGGATYHFYGGKSVGALPDGRKALTPLADGAISPMVGTDVKGPTAVINSALKIDPFAAWTSLFNMKIPPGVLATAEGIEKLKALIRTYFDGNGYHIQFNHHDRKTLLAAKARPEDHKDLMVRVAGFSAFFVDLPPQVQDEIIARTEHRL